jgi:hypothetical protein
VFGEGLTILKDEVFQLTWQEHEVFVYDLAGKLKREMHNPRDGWGLTNDGTNLIFSEGGNRSITPTRAPSRSANLLFCIKSGTDWQNAAVTGETVTGHGSEGTKSIATLRDGYRLQKKVGRHLRRC